MTRTGGMDYVTYRLVEDSRGNVPWNHVHGKPVSFAVGTGLLSVPTTGRRGPVLKVDYGTGFLEYVRDKIGHVTSLSDDGA